MENLSFGYKAGESITPDHHSVPHFVVQGTDDYTPQILSDRIILTPPYPGNRRGSIWAQDALYHKGDWTAELDFRATGMERGGGNLQFWYVRDSQAHETPASLYTSPKFDGLVLLIDQYEGHGGSIRGFLNDGTKDIKSHPDPDTLAFGKCDYAYRNRGELTPIKMHHAQGFLEVIVDGQLCFKTDKVRWTCLWPPDVQNTNRSSRSNSLKAITLESAPHPPRAQTHSKFTNSSYPPSTRTSPIRPAQTRRITQTT